MRIDFDALVAESGRLDATCDSLRERVSKAKTVFGDLVYRSWGGESSRAFRTSCEAWSSAADDSVCELERLVTALRATTAEIAENEAKSRAETTMLLARVPSEALRSLMGGA